MRLDANHYSVHPSVIGRRPEICAGLDEVVVTCAGAEVARDLVRVPAAAKTSD